VLDVCALLNVYVCVTVKAGVRAWLLVRVWCYSCMSVHICVALYVQLLVLYATQQCSSCSSKKLRLSLIDAVTAIVFGESQCTHKRCSTYDFVYLLAAR
jgi:hypothetical protein